MRINIGKVNIDDLKINVGDLVVTDTSTYLIGYDTLKATYFALDLGDNWVSLYRHSLDNLKQRILEDEIILEVIPGNDLEIRRVTNG